LSACGGSSTSRSDAVAGGDGSLDGGRDAALSDGSQIDASAMDAASMDALPGVCSQDGGCPVGEPPPFCNAGGYCWELPMPLGDPLTGIWGTSASDVWIAGMDRALLHWDGHSFTRQSLPITGHTYAVYGIGTQLFAVGEGGAIATLQGGAWQTMASTSTDDLHAIHGSATNDLWATGDNGAAIHYDGTSWKRLASTLKRRRINGVFSLGPTEAYFAANSGFALTWNGLAISSDQPTTFDLLSVYAPAVGTAYEAGKSGTVIKGGFRTTWTPVQMSFMGQDIVAADGSGPDDMYLLGSSGLGFKYDGMLWSQFSVPFRKLPDGSSTSVTVATARLIAGELWASGYAGLVVHGLNTPMPSMIGDGPIDSMESVHIVSSTLAYGLGFTGRMWRFDGTHWALGPSITDSSASAAYWRTPKDAWAVNLAEIRRFDGLTWSRSINPTMQFLNGVWAASANDAWAAGQGPTILRFDGMTWTPQAMPMNSIVQLTAVYGTASDDVWFAGDALQFLHWDGNSLNVVPVPRSLGPSAQLWGSSRTDVWAVGNTLSLHWGGSSWTEVPLPMSVTGQLLAIDGTGPTDVWAVGEGGVMLHSDGHQWSIVPSGTHNRLLCVHALTGGKMLIGGDYGTILSHGLR
jgi:hypothetical protein